jgi:hypothetical protein
MAAALPQAFRLTSLVMAPSLAQVRAEEISNRGFLRLPSAEILNERNPDQVLDLIWPGREGCLKVVEQLLEFGNLTFLVKPLGVSRDVAEEDVRKQLIVVGKVFLQGRAQSRKPPDQVFDEPFACCVHALTVARRRPSASVPARASRSRPL